MLLDEPTSQLDPEAAALFLAAVERLGATVVVSEHRVARALELATRVVFVDGGRVLLDAPRAQALEWLSAERPLYTRACVSETQAPSGAVVASLKGVSYAYRQAMPVLDGVDLELRRGEIVALEGPNGSGKTTLARIAAGLVEPQAGTVELRGRAGYLSQDPGRYLVKETALAEVALAVNGDEQRAGAALERAGLGWAAGRHPRDLSSGERERLALASVAVAEPDLLILDEPTRGLDPERKVALGAWLEEYAASGKAVLLATHDRDLPARRRIGLCVSETQARSEERSVGV
ncbi:MAG TPA: ATP-binding cassette domain-containing protein [Gaiellaceae bacterium]|nr:ATP-binding cassette domain-containing protein [Gaiellaceae bacterium]